MLSVTLTGEVLFGKGYSVDQEGDGKFNILPTVFKNDFFFILQLKRDCFSKIH